jgi:hypothetical protein
MLTKCRSCKLLRTHDSRLLRPTAIDRHASAERATSEAARPSVTYLIAVGRDRLVVADMRPSAIS